MRLIHGRLRYISPFSFILLVIVACDEGCNKNSIDTAQITKIPIIGIFVLPLSNQILLPVIGIFVLPLSNQNELILLSVCKVQCTQTLYLLVIAKNLRQ